MTFEKWVVRELNSILCKINEIELNGGIESVQEGENISIDYSDPKNPIISSTAKPVDITPIQKRLAKVENKIITVESRLDSTESRLTTNERQIYQHSIDINNLSLQDDIIKDRITDVEYDVSIVKNNVNTIKSDVLRIDNTVSALDVKVKANTKAISDNATDIALVKQKNSEQDVSLSSLNTRVDTNTADIQSNRTSLLNKLNKPIFNTTDLTNYTDLVVVDSQGNSAKLNVNTVGKVDKVMGIGPDSTKNVDISSINPNWTGQHRFSNLQNKKSDLSYDRLIGADSAGNMADVGFGALRGVFGGLTQAQALELGQMLNGGQGAEGAISVNLISPPVVQKINSSEYILLRGVNLNLSATAKKIEIIDSATKVTAVTIPDNQIQLYPDGLSLVFYYNFKDLVYGTYLIRLTSGSKIYETTLELKVVANVNDMNVDALSWNIAYDSSITPNPSDSASGRNVTINTPVGIGSIPKVAVKSNEIFARGQDFYLELKVNLGTKSSSNDINRSYVGIGYSQTANTLAHNALINSQYEFSSPFGVRVFNNSEPNIVLAQNAPLEYTVTFIKTGNLFRTILLTSNSAKTLSNNSGYSVFMSIVGRQVTQTVQLQIIKAYTFN